MKIACCHSRVGGNPEHDKEIEVLYKSFKKNYKNYLTLIFSRFLLDSRFRGNDIRALSYPTKQFFLSNANYSILIIKR